MKENGGYIAAIVGLLVVVVLVVASIFVICSTGFGTIPALTQNFSLLSTPKPTPFLFEEITTPYLRNRKFESRLGEMEKVSENSLYTSYITSYDSDGLKINGLLTLPKSDKPEGGFPGIVFVHGYIPPQNYRTTSNYVSYVDYLAREGFVVFKIDLRGHGESEGEAGGAYYSSDYIIDTLNAYSALQNSDFVDPERIGLWGHSMAGNVTFRSFVVNSKIPALVIWAGAGYTYSDLSEYRISDQSYRPPPTDSERAKKRKLLTETYGSFDPESWFWKLVPGTNYLSGVTGAIEIHHAVDDNVVSIEYSRNLMKVLDVTEIKHGLHEYVSGGHNLTGSSFSEAMRKTANFFRENLKDE